MLPELHCLVGDLRKAISKIDHDYVRDLQVNEGLSIAFSSIKEVSEQSAKGETDLYTISSWCRIPFYDADFGVGKPVWIGSVGSINPGVPNAIILMDTKDGNGIEAWVGLTEEDMLRFECDREFITYTSSNNF
ncbi:Vinorine synthase [Thalictrum thalictroides]|uniref:Vinorine synthase n=1 Tax=Thalictrum thalictroides TaxID=46969 RepID=A0A7J6VSY4_THATH|nr:Vinorine synthase [Thalictrum thalictroides]